MTSDDEESRRREKGVHGGIISMHKHRGQQWLFLGVMRSVQHEDNADKDDGRIREQADVMGSCTN